MHQTLQDVKKNNIFESNIKIGQVSIQKMSHIFVRLCKYIPIVAIISFPNGGCTSKK